MKFSLNVNGKLRIGQKDKVTHLAISFNTTIMRGGQNGWGKNCPPSSLWRASRYSVQGILDINKSQILALKIDSNAKSSEKYANGNEHNIISQLFFNKIFLKRHANVWKDSALGKIRMWRTPELQNVSWKEENRSWS